MFNLLYFYVTGRAIDLNEVTESEYIGFKSPHQENIDQHTYSFIYKMRYKELGKLRALKAHVLDAFFMNEDEKRYHTDRFGIVQRCDSVFGRLARIFKLKRAKRFDIDCDLCTTPFSALPRSILTDIYDARTQTIYRFRLSDLVSLSDRALAHAPDFFAEPLALKNPYTNLPFTKAQLYNIYFAIRESPLTMPSLFHLWFMSNFNLKLFLRRNECILVNAAIYHFIKNGSDEEWLEQIYEMVDHHPVWLHVSDDFPDDILLEALLPYLHDYLLASYSLSPTLRRQAEIHLRRGLARFRLRNPLFGRKIYRASGAYYIGVH